LNRIIVERTLFVKTILVVLWFYPYKKRYMAGFRNVLLLFRLGIGWLIGCVRLRLRLNRNFWSLLLCCNVLSFGG
jgi:hypothetical protein